MSNGPRTPKQFEDLVLANLRRYQLQSGISQAEMAVAMQRSLGGTWETGRVWRVLRRKVTPDLQTIEAAAQSLGITFEALTRVEADSDWVLRHLTRDEVALVEILRRRGPEAVASLRRLLNPETARRRAPRHTATKTKRSA